MKVLLVSVNAKYIHSNLAVLDLKAYAEKYAVKNPVDPMEISVAEYTINHQADDILMDIYRRAPQLVAFSCYIWNIEMILGVAADLHSVLPDVDIWLGGPEVSYDAAAVLESNPFLRGIMCGEGEETFRELMEYYHGTSDRTLDSLKGIVYRSLQGQNAEIVSTPAREPIDMNRIPFPYGDMEQFRNKIIYYETSRGCPFGCAYCLSSVDRKVRFRDFALVRDELDFFLANRVPQVKFVDRTFNCSRRHAMEIWNYVHEHDNNVTNFHFEVSADLLGEEELELFSHMRPGLIQLEIGVQSTNPGTIRQIDRTMDLEELKGIVERIHKFGNINQHLDLIAGLPEEDYESFRNSYREVYAMKPEQLQLGFLKVLKGSPMHSRTEEYGIGYKKLAPYEVLYTRWLPYSDVLRLKVIEEMTEVYYNSRQFVHTMEVLSSEYENPFDLYRELGDFYEERGFDKVSHSRLKRYEILLEFIRAKWPGDELRDCLYRELMTLDLYLREKVKSRPFWAGDASKFRNRTITFYQQEEKAHLYLREDLYGGFGSRQLESMTQLEYFRFPVLEMGYVPEKAGAAGQYAVLFDYKKRDGMTGDASAVYVRTSDGGWEC